MLMGCGERLVRNFAVDALAAGPDVCFLGVRKGVIVAAFSAGHTRPTRNRAPFALTGEFVDFFAHFTLLLSFVFALALAHVLSSATDLVRERNRVHFSWTHGLWMATAVIALFGNWMALWNHRNLKLDIASSAIQFLFTIVQYFTCSIVSPRVPERGRIDLWRYHESHKRQYLTAFLILGLFAVGLNVYFWWRLGAREPVHFLFSQLNVVPIVLCVVIAMFAKPVWLQFGCAAAVVLMIVYSTSTQTV
jgi:hypothetical protein